MKENEKLVLEPDSRRSQIGLNKVTSQGKLRSIKLKSRHCRCSCLGLQGLVGS